MSEHFSLWQERCAQSAEAGEKARAVLGDMKAASAVFGEMCLVPQGEPHHCEGKTVESHIERALIFLFVLSGGEHVLNVDEWSSARHLKGFFIRLQETVVKEQAFLLAYILAHDIGKKDTAVCDEKGWHYHAHARKGAEADYASFREECLRYAGRSIAEGKLLRELVRVHMDIIEAFAYQQETKTLRVVCELANRQGLNTERFMSLVPAAFLLDAVLGSVDVQMSWFEKAQLMLRYAEQEYATFPERKEEDALRIHREEKEARRAQLLAHGLGPEEWFATLNTPYGQERGRVVKVLEHFIAGVEDDEDVRYVGAERAHELRMRSARLRENNNKVSS